MSLLYPRSGGPLASVGLLVLRLVAGSAFVLHGWPKIQNPTGWMGPEATVPAALQAAGAVAEFGGGIAWILGALTPLFSLLLAGTMAYALFMVHVRSGHGFVVVNFVPPSSSENAIAIVGRELAAVYLAVAVLLLLAGPGMLSVDAVLFGAKSPEVAKG
jgi:putative oxidoreductase